MENLSANDRETVLDHCIDIPNSVDRAPVIAPSELRNTFLTDSEGTTINIEMFTIHNDNTITPNGIHSMDTNGMTSLVTARADTDNISHASTVSTLSSISSSSAGTQDGGMSQKTALSLDSCSDLEHLGNVQLLCFSNPSSMISV